MRRLIGFVGLSIGAICMGMSMSGCGGKRGERRPPVETDSIFWIDSLRVADCSAHFDINGLYPTGKPHLLVDSVRNWLAYNLAYGNMYADIPLFETDTINETDGQKLLAITGKALLSFTENDFNEYAKDNVSVDYEFDINFHPQFESDSLLTYNYNGYGEMGGAHGSMVYYSQTFNANNGESLTWANSFVPSRHKALLQLVKEELWKQYFTVYMENTSDRSNHTLRDVLIIDPDTMSLPAAAPEFLEDGVRVTYQQYEISYYAAGMPTCLLPYSRLDSLSLLTPEAKRLIPKSINKKIR